MARFGLLSLFAQVRRRWRSAPAAPEESLRARLAVLAAAAVADLALLATTQAGPVVPLCLAAVGVGHWVSWRGRNSPRRRPGQALLAALVALAVAYLLSDLFLGAFGGTLPQAKFAILVQAITAFDLKTRRNLFSHLWHSLAVLYVAALFAFDASFAPFVLLWGMAAWLFLRWTALAVAPAPPGPGRRWGMASGPMAVWMVLAAAVFVLLPRFPGRPLAVPIVVSLPFTNTSAEALPAALPLVGGQVSPSAGFNLRARGRFGDEVVFHVRATGAGYWQMDVLHEYTHTEWLRGAVAGRNASGVLSGLTISGEPPGGGPLSESFFVERPLGDELISAYPLGQLFFPARRVRVSSDGVVQAPAPLGPGVIYTAVAELRDTSPARLRGAGRLGPGGGPDLALPPAMPPRVGALASQLRGAPTEYDQVMRDLLYLRASERYTLNPPRLPAGADAVDQFLFVEHAGFCEQFASALAVLLRYQGIPARVAIGYLPGERDPLTGTYTVRNLDAHAWVQAYFPSVGWISVDPSPGYPAAPQAHSTGDAFLGDLRVDVGSLSVAPAVLTPLLGPLLGVALVGAVIGRWWGRRRLSPALRRYRDAQWWLRRAGLPDRLPAQTVREHLETLGRRSPAVADSVAPLAFALETAVYGAPPPPGGGGSVPRVAGRALAARVRALLTWG